MLLRHSVLPRLKSSSQEQEVKAALLVSDFGSPTLFGPVNSEKAESYKPGTTNFWKFRLDSKNVANKGPWDPSIQAAKKPRRGYQTPKPAAAASVNVASQSFTQEGKPPGKQKRGANRGRYNNKKRKS